MMCHARENDNNYYASILTNCIELLTGRVIIIAYIIYTYIRLYVRCLLCAAVIANDLHRSEILTKQHYTYNRFL